MSSNTRVRISQMLYHLSNENRAAADRELGEIIKIKTKQVFDRELQKVKNTLSKEK